MTAAPTPSTPSAAAGAAAVAVRVEPSLAEAAVRIVLSTAGAPEAAVARHRSRSDPLYELADGRARDAGFAALALAEFEELGLANPLLGAMDERPALASRVTAVFVATARGRRDAGITCEPAGTRLGVRADPEAFADAGVLRAWARHALGHAEDTLDSSFAFRPGWDERPGALHAAEVLRLHRLWDVSVDGRLAAAGRLAGQRALRRHRDLVAADMAGAGPAVVDAIVERLWDGPRPTFPELAAWAERPSDLARTVAGGRGSAIRPDRCPLCRFAGSDVTRPADDVAASVTADYPDWRPDDGLCGRCADRYRLARRLGGRP